MLKKMFIAGAIVTIATAGVAVAEEKKDNQAFETGAGAVTGAAAGAVIGGPVGAVVGGVAGAAIGAAASVPEPARDYVIAHPVEPVVIEERVVVGTVVPETIVVQPIPDTPELGYIYVDGQPVYVKLDNREVIYIDG